MLETFEMYVRHPQNGPGRFKIVTCAREQVVDQARALLDTSRGEEVEVRRRGERLFTVVK